MRAAITAPAETDANRKPASSGPPPNCVRASAGNSTLGMPNTIAMMSTMNVPWSTFRPSR